MIKPINQTLWYLGLITTGYSRKCSSWRYHSSTPL